MRNLTPGEMLGQIYAIEKDTGERVSHVVVMGSGEPLDNLDNLIRFLRLVSDEEGAAIGQRNITVSTCGLVPEIYRLAEERFQITLALSLHACLLYTSPGLPGHYPGRGGQQAERQELCHLHAGLQGDGGHHPHQRGADDCQRDRGSGVRQASLAG